MKLNEIVLIEATRPRPWIKDGPHLWEKSKWWPKNPGQDASPTKLAFDAMVKDAIKTWPKKLREVMTAMNVGVGGNSIFDCFKGLMYEFEDAESDFATIPLDSFYKDVVEVGSHFETYRKAIEVIAPKIKALQTNKKLVTFDDFKAAVTKIKAPTVYCRGNSERAHITFTVADQGYVQMNVREEAYDSLLKKKIPGAVLKYLPSDATKEFSFDAEEAMLNLFNVVVHLNSWSGLFGIYDTPSFEFKNEPLEVSIQPEDYTAP